ncbi:cobaltochelatase subunit CobN [Roseomonas gilardii subsp. gilardii]|uniref:cobaltochelatase subunit CobN n=1 Tax=Roseomonas gilardii TaxID=257708 RepID=UPI001FFB0BB2|nr:cobaltochelatase subunit CobN [Roseomonas gilardii]UPG71223.1 cobaltochelatase subunit CobN [Roseomonas gilardii subsp. gilardii]
MHLLVRETRGLDEADAAVDLGQAPAELVLLSFSDSDLGAAATAWLDMEGTAMPGPRPELRLASLGRLRHPLSVDLYLENTLAASRCVVARLLGGLDYWRYGAEELAALARREGIALALLPGDGRDDARLRALSTLPEPAWRWLDAAFAAGGPGNAGAALRFMAALARDPAAAPPPAPEALPEALPPWGEHPLPGGTEGAVAAITFYRSHLLAGDIAPVTALAGALAARGLRPRALFADSLKSPGTAQGIAATLCAWKPAVVLNLTGFSARRDEGGSPFDAPGVPVLQLLLSSAPREVWAASARGLSQSDLAMQVALPELDGRLLTTAVAHKAEDAAIAGLGFARTLLRPDPDGIALAADRAAAWARLAATPRAGRRLGIVLSDYPGVGGQEGHAVGLDSFASLEAILRLLRAEGYDLPEPPEAAALAERLCRAAPEPVLGLEDYRRLFATLPEGFRARVEAAWGGAEADPSLMGGAAAEGGFRLRHLRLGPHLLVIQPDRGDPARRKASYHDPDLPPRHGFIAFHLWLREAERVHALVHLGTHGALEWLPGKAAALSPDCAPAALLGGLPVIYPFIVNNPGEAAAAKRRLGAVTIGHLTPPLRPAGLQEEGVVLERLIDEYAAADGLDRRRTALLRREILERAESCGLLAESGVAREAPEEEALARLDAYLCDVKEMQIRDGLHVFGQDPAPERRALLLEALDRSNPGLGAEVLAARLDACAMAERAALLAALDGRFVAPGPAGAPSRGRADVLPTGRNLFALDPRSVPTRSALVLAEKAAGELLRRHQQEQGDFLRHLVIDLWGSATLRTGGEELALALVLMGVRPAWDAESGRASGIEVLPLAMLDRPRVDVTLRISGLFRDAFPAQIALFDMAVRAVAARDEAAEWNPVAASARGLDGTGLRRATARIFGAAPGDYGAGTEDLLARGGWEGKEDLARAYLAASGHAYGQDLDGRPDPEGFAARLAGAGAFLQVQDHAETDLLDSPDRAAHAGGFAAAACGFGTSPRLYHADTSRPEAPRLRAVEEEIARVVRGRAANPLWIAGQMRHGRRGAAEIARAAEALHGFAATLPARFDAQFDLIFEHTLGDEAVDRFLRGANPEAREALRRRLAEALARGLWRPRRNSAATLLEGA